MMIKNLVLRCYAEKEKDDSWFAICIDLNLCAQGDALEEVTSKLSSFIASYLQEAFNEDREYIKDLIPRKAPFSFVCKYYYLKAELAFSKFINHIITKAINGAVKHTTFYADYVPKVIDVHIKKHA